MIELFNTLLIDPMQTSLLWLNGVTGSLGASIIILTLGIRAALLPLTRPSMKAAAKMRQLQPEIDQLKKKYPDDKLKQQQAQMELFKEHQVNPAAGCLPQILQFIFLIALYRVFIEFFNNGQDIQNTVFLGIDLASSSGNYLLAGLAAVLQLGLAFMIMPGSSTAAEQAIAESTPEKEDDQAAQDMTQMAATMQKQMVYIMPAMTLVLALQFPAGLVVYWITSTVFSMAQQYTVSGLGGLENALAKVKSGTQK